MFGLVRIGFFIFTYTECTRRCMLNMSMNSNKFGMVLNKLGIVSIIMMDKSLVSISIHIYTDTNTVAHDSYYTSP